MMSFKTRSLMLKRIYIIIIPSGGSILIPSRRDLPIDILQEEIEHYAFQDEITSIEGESTSNQS